MAKRGTRESRTESGAQIPALEEAWKALERAPSGLVGGRKRRRAPRGLLATAEHWVERHPGAMSLAVQTFAKQRDGSQMATALSETLGQLVTAEEGLLCPPVVRQDRGKQALRYGFFHALTDRDAFVEALLGRPVPKQPRYLEVGPRPAVEIDASETFLAEVKMAAGLGEPGVSSQTGVVSRNVIAKFVTDPGLRAAASDMAVRSAAAFAELPIAKILEGPAEDRPLWHLPGPEAAAEFARAFPIGRLGWMGMAWWVPGDYEFRKYRRPMAAHLRYLFDHVVSPWNRWSDVRTRSEVASLLWRRPRGVSMSHLAEEVRQRHPDRYQTETTAATIRRLYRLNARLRPERRLVEQARRST